ncbi:hypothetical protein Nmel_007522 [Mimus melanotis]
MPKAINKSKLFEIKQNHNKSPTKFLNHLKETT